jgi:hypothetical protein
MSLETFSSHVLRNLQLPCLEKPSAPMSLVTFSSHIFRNLQLPCLEKPSTSMSLGTFSSHVFRNLQLPCLEKPSAPISWENFSSHFLRKLQLPCPEKPSAPMSWETFNFHVPQKRLLLTDWRPKLQGTLRNKIPRVFQFSQPLQIEAITFSWSYLLNCKLTAWPQSLFLAETRPQDIIFAWEPWR